MFENLEERNITKQNDNLSISSKGNLSNAGKELSGDSLYSAARKRISTSGSVGSDGGIYKADAVCKEETLTVYPIRWGVLLAVCFLNISNGALFINYFPTATVVANYYETTIEKINWFSVIFMITSVPGSFIGPYCTHKFGLRTVIWIGCLFNAAGATVRMLATSGLISSLDSQYVVGLCGQVLSAIGQNFLLYLHTKVSQTWFPEHQRGIATTCLAIADPVGVLIAEVSVPYIINESEDVPLNDKIWFGLAILSVIFTAIFVRRSKPPTPPSRSASRLDRPPYLQQLRTALSTPAFLFLMLSLGGGVAFTVAFQTVTEEILCPLGYSAEFGGLVNAIMLLFGFAGSAMAGIMLDRTRKYTEITMYLFGIAAVVGILLFEFLMHPGKEVAICIMAALFGIFGVSIFPVGLELAVEATYPVEETITTAFVFLSGQIQAVVIIIIIPALSFDKLDTTLSVCNLDFGGTPQDYTISLMVVMAFLVIICCTSLLFFKTDYKRQKAELAMKQATEHPYISGETRRSSLFSKQ